MLFIPQRYVNVSPPVSILNAAGASISTTFADIDITANLPKGAKAVALAFLCRNSAALGAIGYVRQKGVTSGGIGSNGATMTISGPGTTAGGWNAGTGIVPTDPATGGSDRVIQYAGSSFTAAGNSEIDLQIVGYWL